MGEPPSRIQPPDRGSGPPPPARDVKPTPVRDALAEDAGPAPEVRLPGREFVWKGEAWWAQELGRTRSGQLGDPGAELVLLGFRPAQGDPGEFVREALVQGTSLEGIPEGTLARLAEAAGPFRTIPDEPPPFFGPRGRERDTPPPPRGRGGGRRERR